MTASITTSTATIRLIDDDAHRQITEYVLKARLQPICSNRLLLSLPQSEYLTLSEKLHLVEVNAGEVLHIAHTPVRHVWFPNDCLISIRAEVLTGTGLEVALVGNDGATDTADRCVDMISPLAAVVQISGSAMRIDVATLSSFFKSSGILQYLFFQMLDHQWMQASQNAVCSHYHLLEARLARTLLRIRDRTGRDDFHLTHEIMAHALGVRRVGVTKAAMALQSLALIRYARGSISVIDAAGLAKLACSCYQIDCQHQRLIDQKIKESAFCVR